MAWQVEVKEAALDHLRWFGKRTGRLILRKALERLCADPLADTRNMKTLRPNPVAQREIRLFGKYRVLFSVDEQEKQATIILVGEKRGNTLLVCGEEFSDHESDSTQ
jgi:mRNA-degrading endonuclease RelE of RelBE toxin-antitoxin system